MVNSMNGMSITDAALEAARDAKLDKEVIDKLETISNMEVSMPSKEGANRTLGLPYGKMQKVAICFDVDGTLIDAQFADREHITRLMGDLHKLFKNAKLVIWSGGGNKYAEDRARQLGIDQYAWKFMSKHQHTELRALGYIILAIDDIQDTAIGDINLIVRQ